MGKLTKRDITLLKHFGFKEEYPDEVDPNYCEWTKYFIGHPLLKRLHVMVVDDRIAVWCEEANGGISGGDFLLAGFNYSEDRLLSLMMYIKTTMEMDL